MPIAVLVESDSFQSAKDKLLTPQRLSGKTSCYSRTFLYGAFKVSKNQTV